MGLAVLTIGTATDRMSLLEPWGVCVTAWRPLRGDNSTVWQDSLLANYRWPAVHKYTSTIDQFTITIRQRSQDQALATITQRLSRFLEQGLNYWQPGTRGVDPVYLEARADCETNSRYACVLEGKLVEEGFPYSSPFTNRAPAMLDLPLIIEHTGWRDQPPGGSSCVAISAQQGFGSGQITVTSAPAASEDDAWLCLAYDHGEVLQVASIILPIGDYGVCGYPTQVGIRFPAVLVPQGATIVDAFITFTASGDTAVNTVNLFVYGEDTDDAAQYSDALDFLSRTATSSRARWTAVPAWTGGNPYDTPPLSAPIQEIVNRPGWASGNAMGFIIKDNGSDANAHRIAFSWDGAGATEAVLTVTYTTGSGGVYGREATCLDEVYLANKENRANITHIYTYDASGPAWSGNLLGSALPYGILPAVPANNDSIYFGCQDSLSDSGPFCSLVFDIGTEAFYTGNAAINWQYWNGAWVNIPALDLWDNTSITGPFSIPGVNSVHWDQLADWATTAINGVTAYWIRALVSIPAPPADSITQPTQANRDVYTCLLPYVNIAAEEIEGDMAALGRILIHGRAAIRKTYSPNVERSVGRTLLGLRSTIRGTGFTAFLNFSPGQNPTGLTATPHLHTVQAADSTMPAGYHFRFTPIDATLTWIAGFSFSPALIREYIGVYRGFLRVRHNEVAGETYRVQANVLTGYGSNEFTTPLCNVAIPDYMSAVDLGRIEFSPVDVLTDDEQLDWGVIDILAQSSGATGSLDLVDLILIPADEWIGEALINPATAYEVWAGLGTGRILDIDSIVNPRRNIRAILRDSDTDEVTISWLIRSGEVALPSARDMRLYLFGTRMDGKAPFEVVNSLRVEKVQRYRGGRGDG